MTTNDFQIQIFRNEDDRSALTQEWLLALPEGIVNMTAVYIDPYGFPNTLYWWWKTKEWLTDPATTMGELISGLLQQDTLLVAIITTERKPLEGEKA